MSYGQSIVIVEDDDELRTVLARGLREEGFSVEGVATGAQLLDRVEQATPDAFVIDIGLPDSDGRDLVRAGWPHGAIVRENTLDAYLARLRRKLRTLEHAPEIATVHGVGYKIR